MQPYTQDLSDHSLLPQQKDIAIGQYRYRAETGREGGFVLENGPEGSRKYPIAHVMGGKNVFYFLTPLDRGRLQVLPVSYDVRRKEWFDTTASAMRHFQSIAEEPYHWKDWPYTFNTACYGCHVSQLEKNYDLKTDSYHTAWREPGINCETCHGPAQSHLEAVRQTPPTGVLSDPRIISTRKFTSEQMNTLCAPCHAKMMILTTNFLPGDRYFDHYDLITFEHPDFYPDGRDLGENYTYTSWRHSPCLKSDQFNCMHCHTSSGRMRFTEADRNQACLPCHENIVNNATAHSHHPAGTPGNQCVACHMPKTEFARMERSDHSMRSPTPATTLAFHSPNACNLCHTNRDAAWADGWVRQWYSRDYQKPVLEMARLIDAARQNQWNRLSEMLSYIQRPDRDEISANALVRLLANAPSPEVQPALLDLLRDPSPLIRASAAASLRSPLDSSSLASVVQATRDSYRVVRARAAGLLAAAPLEQFRPEDRTAVETARNEYLVLLRARPDDAASHHNLASYHHQRRELNQALDSYRTAVRLQPDNVPSLANLSLLYNEMGQNGEAEASLRQALRYQPTNASLNFNLGLLLGEMGRPTEARTALHTAIRSDPTLAAAAYNLAILLAQDRQVDQAVSWCRRALQLAPNNTRYAYTLAFYLTQQDDNLSAIQILQPFTARSTEDASIYILLGDIYERTGRRSEALSVYQQAAWNDLLPADARAQFTQRAQALSKSSP
jgi:tetratricopeptide (TPR) repeat protein